MSERFDRVRFRRRLLAWFDRHRRDLPWRRDRDPYRIWVSEVMLQQTTVAAVIPYFDRFMAAFPTVHELAAATEQDVLRHWQGLGYYRRARHLHAAAQRLAALPQMPFDEAIWASLPGVGRYILGAVLSQAYDAPAPVVEANITRVLCRLFGERRDPKSAEVVAGLWTKARELLARARPGDFNQAMMELGQRICRPIAPLCGECPVRASCLAFATQTQATIPLRPAAPTLERVREVAMVIRRAGRVLIAQRSPDADRWQSMWEFPQSQVVDGETHERSAERWCRLALGLTIRCGPELATSQYAVTRFRISMTALWATARGRLRCARHYSHALWVEPAALANYPMSTVQRRLAGLVRDGVMALF